MNEPLDDDIVSLLGDVVATTPEPPQLKEHAMSFSHDDDTGGTKSTNKWVIGGGVGLLAAAAAVGFFVITGDDTETMRQDPAVTAPVETAAPTTTAPTSTLPDATVDGSVAVPPPSQPSDTTPTTEVPTTETPTTETPRTETGETAGTPVEVSAALTAAGPAGVTVAEAEADGSGTLVVSEPMAFATTAQDGRVFMQRSVTSNESDADTTLFVVVPGSDELTPLDPPLAAGSDPLATVRLHDVATVDGDVTLLYEVVPLGCLDPNECIGAIMTWSPDTGTSSEIASKIVFEGGWSGLELADNGLVVGEEYEGSANSIFLASMSDVTPPTPGDLGLEDFYNDCIVCPNGYTVDPSGTFIGWIDSGDGADQDNTDPDALPSLQAAVVDISDDGGFARRRVAVDVTSSFGELDIADVVFGDGGFVAGRAVFQSGETDDSGNAIAPVTIDLVSGAVGPIDATSATLNRLIP